MQKWALLLGGVALGLVILIGFTGDRASAAGPRYPLGSPEAAEAQAFDPFDPEAAMDPQDPGLDDEFDLWDLMQPGSKPSLHKQPTLPPTANVLIFIPDRPPASSPIR